MFIFLPLLLLFLDPGPSVPYGLERYKSWPHLPKGPKGRARQAAQKEAADARKKKRTKEVQQKEEKKEVTQRVRARERRSDVESELTSDDPTDVDDMVFSDEEGSQEVIMTSAEHRGRATTSAGDE